MMVLRIAVWIVAIAVLAAAIAVAAIAIVTRRPKLALVAVIPVAIGLLRIVFGIVLPAPDQVLVALAGLAIAILAIVAGNPITVAMLNFADARSDSSISVDGEHGGIIVPDPTPGSSGHREVLRGGTVIGYLERLIVVAAVAIGHWELVAVLVAIKGLGRFSELDSPEPRERFIIGTLVSMVWAGACSALFVL